MSWNYRIVKRLHPNGEVVFGIHEAYTGMAGEEENAWLLAHPERTLSWDDVKRCMENGEPLPELPDEPEFVRDTTTIQAISEDPIEPMGETLEELLGDMERMAEALRKPVLDYDTALGQPMV